MKYKAEYSEDKLTWGERRIAQQLLLGKNNNEIADTLGIANKTVRYHLGNMFKKYKVKNRLQMALELAELQIKKENKL